MIIAGVYNTVEASTFGKVLNVDDLVAGISANGKLAQSMPDADAIVEYLGPVMREGDVVAVMSNGGFGGIHEKLLDALRA